MRSLPPALLALALSLTAACLPGASVDGGEINGVEFQPRSAIHFEEQDIVFILISDTPNLCDRLGDNEAAVEDFKLLGILLGNIDEEQSAKDIEPGEFVVGEEQGNIAIADFTQLDGDCFFESGIAATGGTVTVDSYDRDSAAVGSFSLEMGEEAEEVDGSFRTESCAIDVADLERNDDCEP